MKLKTFWKFSLSDSTTNREYLKTSGTFVYAGKPKAVKDAELVRLLMNRAAVKGDVETVRFMLDNGAVVEGKQVEALPLAIDHGSQGVAVLLIEAGADVSLVDKDTKQTLLHRAALKAQPETCRALLQCKQGLKLDAKNAQGSTALHCAAAVGNERTVALLLGAGAKRKKKNEHANTPAHLAKLNGHLQLAALLERKDSAQQSALPPTDPLASNNGRITRIE